MVMQQPQTNSTPQILPLAAYDLYDQKKAYKRNGIQEYIVWQS
jgi:hypothetical protein